MVETIVTTYLIPAFITALTGFIAWVSTKIKSIYEEKVKNETVKQIVEDVVKYVERTLKSESNQKKYNQAVELASEWITSKGFTISAVELKLMIESAVNNLPKTNEEE